MKNEEIIRLMIPRVFDAHLHLRKGAILKTVLPYTAEYCGQAIIIGNTMPPIDNLERLFDYKQEIETEGKNYPLFSPVMTIMLTENTTVNTIRECAPYAKALKFIPANTSTGSSQTGVTLEDLHKYYPVLEEAQKHGMTFPIHAERMYDNHNQLIHEVERELFALPFVEDVIDNFPGLKVIIEHVSTKEACELVKGSSVNVAGTITAHHVRLNDCYLYDGKRKIRPEFYCKPVLKAEEHRREVEKMMLSNSSKFFFGSDSAPHPGEKKFINDPPAAGIFSAPVAIAIIAEMFHRNGKLDQIGNFLSVFGRQFYGLPIPDEEILLYNDHQNCWQVEEAIGADHIPVLLGGEMMYWWTTKS